MVVLTVIIKSAGKDRQYYDRHFQLMPPASLAIHLSCTESSGKPAYTC